MQHSGQKGAVLDKPMDSISGTPPQGRRAKKPVPSGCSGEPHGGGPAQSSPLRCACVHTVNYSQETGSQENGGQRLSILYLESGPGASKQMKTSFSLCFKNWVSERNGGVKSCVWINCEDFLIFLLGNENKSEIAVIYSSADSKQSGQKLLLWNQTEEGSALSSASPPLPASASRAGPSEPQSLPQRAVARRNEPAQGEGSACEWHVARA